MTENLTSLLEQHQQEIWGWKQKEAQWIRDKNQLEGNKTIINELSPKLIEMGKAKLVLQAKVNELEGTIGSAQDINEDHQRYNSKLQLRLTEVEEDNKNLAKQIEHLKNQKK
mgnify:CR=1 FL=1